MRTKSLGNHAPEPNNIGQGGRGEIRMYLAGKSTRRRAATGVLAASITAAIAVTSHAAPARAAADPRVAAVFEWIDSNHDGRITAAEFGKSMSRPEPTGAVGLMVKTKIPPPKGETRERLFKRLDSNRDGALSLAELSSQVMIRTRAAPGIAAADTNGDGLFSEGELAAYLTAQRAAAGLAKPSAGVALLARGIVQEHDRDHDGRVALADLQR
jgi:hypothetical protein